MGRAILQQILSRAALAVPILLVVTLFSFVMLFGVGDPAAAIAGENATQEQIDAIRTDLGLDRPIMVQYGDWLAGTLSGDLGESLRQRGDTVGSLIGDYAPATIQIVVGAMVLAVLVSLTMGVLVGLRPGGWLDRVLRGVAMLGIAVPNFLLGLVLMLVFAVWLQALPAGSYRPWSELGAGALQYLVLPVLALAVALICQQMRTFRASLLKEYETDYVRTARMKGLTETEIFFKHVLRNASAPLVTVIGLEVGVLVTGSILVESVFAIPGIGSLMITSVHTQDFAVAQALVLIAAIAVIVANLLADVVALWLNPTARANRE